MQQRRATLVTVLTLVLTGVGSNGLADTNVFSQDAAGLPGGVASPSFTLDFNPSEDVTNISFNWEYDATFLTFQKSQATVDYGGQTRSLASFLDFLKLSFGGSPQFFSTEGGDVGSNHKIYDYTLFADTSITLSGQMVFNLIFEIADTAKAGMETPINVTGNIVDSAGDEFPYETLAIVRAVPEPAEWLLWLSGLGLLAGRSRHRQAWL